MHNWWHLAIYLLEAGDIAGALAIYDAQLHTAESAGVPLEMLDASALLWRLFLDGEDTGDRFDALADAWSTRTDRRTVVRLQRRARGDGARRCRTDRGGRGSVGRLDRLAASIARGHEHRR